MKKVIRCLTVIMAFSLIFSSFFIVRAHEYLLNVEYDLCSPDLTGDGENEVWYYLSEANYSLGSTYRYYHLDDETITIKYFFEEMDSEETGYTWTTDVNNELAEEIKNAYINSVLEWNDVYFYTYDSAGNPISHKIINIIEGTKEDHNLSIYPMRDNGRGTIASTGPEGNAEVINTGTSNVTHLHYNDWVMHVNVSCFYRNNITNLTLEEVNIVRRNTGEHEMGHILGLDDVDICCTRSNQQHHEEIIMGYGDLLDRREDVTYKDIAGVAIIRGFHDDDDHKWMRRNNANGTADLICSICNGVRYDVELGSNGTTYEGKALKEFESCTHHGGGNSGMLLVATDGERDFFKCQYCRCIGTIAHEHTFEQWTYYNHNSHIGTCCCGAQTTRAHAVTLSEVVDYRAYCLGCGYYLDLREDTAITNRVNRVSVNGSYILPSGIVVLVEEDVEAYFAGTLVFYEKENLPAAG